LTEIDKLGKKQFPEGTFSKQTGRNVMGSCQFACVYMCVCVCVCVWGWGFNTFNSMISSLVKL